MPAGDPLLILVRLISGYKVLTGSLLVEIAPLPHGPGKAGPTTDLDRVRRQKSNMAFSSK
jgi:hypothetical protein